MRIVNMNAPAVGRRAPLPWRGPAAPSERDVTSQTRTPAAPRADGTAGCHGAPIPPTYTQDELRATCERQRGWWHPDGLIGGHCEYDSRQ